MLPQWIDFFYPPSLQVWHSNRCLQPHSRFVVPLQPNPDNELSTCLSPKFNSVEAHTVFCPLLLTQFHSSIFQTGAVANSKPVSVCKHFYMIESSHIVEEKLMECSCFSSRWTSISWRRERRDLAWTSRPFHRRWVIHPPTLHFLCCFRFAICLLWIWRLLFLLFLLFFPRLKTMKSWRRGRRDSGP